MLLRNLLKLQVAGARAESADGNDDHGHGEGDQAEDALGAGVLQEERDDEAREDRADAAEGLGEADGAGADAGGKKLGLVAVERVGQDIVRERDEHAEQDQQRQR